MALCSGVGITRVLSIVNMAWHSALFTSVILELWLVCVDEAT